MDIELYQLFFEPTGKEGPRELKLPERQAPKLSRRDANVVSRIGQFVGRMDDRDKKLLVGFAQRLAAR